MSRMMHGHRALPALALGLVAGLSYAGGAAAWKPFLPAGVQQELKSRGEQALAGAKDAKRKEVEKAILQGYERANKGGGELKLAAPEDLGEMMNLLRLKAKGGEGTAEVLQYNGKLKKQDGIEALIGALGSKQLDEDKAAKTSKELELLAYRVAVMGAITHDNPPAKDKLAGWHKLSLEMRDAAVALAEAAAKKDTGDIQKSSARLEASCTKCHRDYR
jgi:hypothetical protein